MKKIALILALSIVLGIAVVNAEIRRGTDNFDDSKWITSNTSNIEDSSWIGFQRKITNTEKEYFIGSSSKSLSYIKFSKEDAEIKIDDQPVQKMAVKEVSSMPSPLESKISFINVTIIVSNELVQQIASAQRVAIRIHKENSIPYVYVLPDAVLAEWKEVIAAEK